ncbi:MAG: ATP-dependent DNA ligase, partial [Gammaproteobacteria bacterium]|nr:ATP-dependent DNA ligase [Gammaproteobacteria bacterium]
MAVVSRLARYLKMRDFGATPEPSGAKAARARRGDYFVVHLHHASHRHFDFRLQVGDTLRSWAIPKGPSLDPATKRLAVEVEDHPLDYGRFEGTIPEGQYGAGRVWIWDKGRWTPEGDPEAALKAGRLSFILKGERLSGRWSLVRTRMSGRQPQWLLLKSRDEAAVAGDEADDTPLSKWRSARAPKRKSAPRRAAPR